MNGVTIIAAGLWAAYLVAAVGSGATAALTAPVQRQLALVAAVALIVLLLLAKPTRGARGDRLLLLVHALPLILLLRLGGGGAWADRTLSPSVWPQLAQVLGGSTIAVPRPAPSNSEATEWPLDHILRTAEPGQHLRMVGRISRPPADMILPIAPDGSWQQPNLVLLYRFRMTCCAADATPAAILVVVEGEVPPDGTWITCTGSVLGRFGPEGSVVVVGASAWAEQAPASQPFLIGSPTPSLY